MLDVVLAGHNTFIAGAAGSRKSFLMKQICERTEKTVCVTSTTGRAAKVLKNKAKTIHSFAGIGDCHEPKEVCCVFHVYLAAFFGGGFREITDMFEYMGVRCWYTNVTMQCTKFVLL